MKASFLACIASLALSLISARAGNITVTIVTNPPQGGTITGGGIYPSGGTVDIGIEAANGWYITNVPSSTFSFVQEVTGFDGGDITTITNFTDDYSTFTSDTIYTVTFAPLSPVVTQAPSSTGVTTGSQVTWSAGVFGRQPIEYEWQQGSQPIAGATNATLTLANVQPTNTGSYTVTASNAFGATNATATLIVRDVLVFVNNQAVTNAVTSPGSATVSLKSRFSPNDFIFYTLDGSIPGPSSSQYFGPFQLSQSAVIRAIAYTNTFLQTAFSDSIPLTIIPTYTLTIPSLSGGTVAMNPPGGVYTNQTVVNLTATPNTNWIFLGWLGGPAGTSLTNTYTVIGNATVIPLFGTTITTNVVGNGTLSLVPASPPYLSGTYVEVTAIPSPGNYLAAWGGAVGGSQNPVSVPVSSPAPPMVSALFAPIPSGDVSLTLLADGDGFVLTYVAGSVFPVGATNTIIAFPDVGEQFLGWSGGVTGTNNYWPVTLTTNTVITAHFTRNSTLSLSRSAGAMDVSISGPPRTVFRIDASSNLSTWTPLGYVTNPGSIYPTSFSDPVTNAPARFYRAVAQ